MTMILSFISIFILFLIWSIFMMKGKLNNLDNYFYNTIKITNFKNHVNIELYPFLLRNITKIISKRHEFETESFYKGTGKKLGDSGEWATQYLLKEKLS